MKSKAFVPLIVGEAALLEETTHLTASPKEGDLDQNCNYLEQTQKPSFFG